jgi:hypothetical protein
MRGALFLTWFVLVAALAVTMRGWKFHAPAGPGTLDILLEDK